MRDIPNHANPGFVAEKSEHYFGCYRLISPVQIHHLTIEFEVSVLRARAPSCPGIALPARLQEEDYERQSR
jgi:hypothetical protein